MSAAESGIRACSCTTFVTTFDIAPVGTSSSIVPALFSTTFPVSTRVSNEPRSGATRSDGRTGDSRAHLRTGRGRGPKSIGVYE